MFYKSFFDLFIGKMVLVRCLSAPSDTKESSFYSGVLETVPGDILKLSPVKNAENTKIPAIQELIAGNVALVPKVIYLPMETIIAFADLQDNTEVDLSEA